MKLRKSIKTKHLLVQEELGNKQWIKPLTRREQRNRSKELNRKNFPSEARFLRLIKHLEIRHPFHRNHPMLGRYFVDFFFSELDLCVEIDGSSHDGKEDYDQRRDNHLKSSGYRVLRLSTRSTDSSWMADLKGILHTIPRKIKKKSRRSWCGYKRKGELRKMNLEAMADYLLKGGKVKKLPTLP